MLSSGSRFCSMNAARRLLSTNGIVPQQLQIPVPSGNYPIVGHLPRLMQLGDAMKWQDMHQECGDIFKANIMGKELVITSSADHAKEILMTQGTYQFRTPQNSWRKIFNDNGWPWGIPFSEGEDWKRRRKVLGQTLLMGKNAKEYIPVVLPAANNFVDCVSGHLTPDGRLVDEVSVRHLVGMFALEAVMKVVTGVDFPACTVPLAPKAVAFQEAVETMFTNSGPCEDIPLHTWLKTKPYRALKESWETMMHYPEENLRPAMEYYQEHGKLPPETNGTILPKLIEQHEEGDLSIKEVIGIAAQAVAAAVDTTGQTTEYLLYNLSKNPEVQDRIVATLGGLEGPFDISKSDYEAQDYLFATLRESMRLTPTIGAHARTLMQDADLSDGYQIPEGTLVLINYFNMTRDPQFFPEPELFLPERFLKKGNSAAHNGTNGSVSLSGGCPYTQAKADAIQNGKAVANEPYAAIPFGHGARKCAGKGFAEMDIHLCIMALLRKYRVEYDGPPLQQRESQLLRPVQPISPHFRFVPREE